MALAVTPFPCLLGIPRTVMMDVSALQTPSDFLMPPTEISIAIFTPRAGIQNLLAAE